MKYILLSRFSLNNIWKYLTSLISEGNLLILIIVLLVILFAVLSKILPTIRNKTLYYVVDFIRIVLIIAAFGVFIYRFIVPLL